MVDRHQVIEVEAIVQLKRRTAGAFQHNGKTRPDNPLPGGKSRIDLATASTGSCLTEESPYSQSAPAIHPTIDPDHAPASAAFLQFLLQPQFHLRPLRGPRAVAQPEQAAGAGDGDVACRTVRAVAAGAGADFDPVGQHETG